MYYASLKLPKYQITSYADAINALPLDVIAIHNSFDAAQAHLHHQGLVYQVNLDPKDIYNVPRLNSNMIKVAAIKTFKQVDVFADTHLKFSNTEDSLHYLNNFLGRRLSYLNFKATIKHLRLPNPTEKILHTLSKCLLVCSLIFFPSLYFAQILSAGVCLSLGALTGILGLVFFSPPKSQELAYADQLSYLCEINSSINQQLRAYFNAQVPQKTFWGPQLA